MNGLILGSLDSGALLLALQTTNEVNDTNDVWSGWGSVIFVLGVIAIVALIAGILIWQIFKTNRDRYTTRATIAHEEAYRKLAEDLAAAQEKMVEELMTMRENMADMQQRVASMERLLREVE